MYKKICLSLIVTILMLLVSNISLAAGYNTIDNLYDTWKETFPDYSMREFAEHVANDSSGAGIPTTALTAVASQDPAKLNEEKRNLWYELAGALVGDGTRNRSF